MRLELQMNALTGRQSYSGAQPPEGTVDPNVKYLQIITREQSKSSWRTLLLEPDQNRFPKLSVTLFSRAPSIVHRIMRALMSNIRRLEQDRDTDLLDLQECRLYNTSRF
jgi:hypothetical protein